LHDGNGDGEGRAGRETNDDHKALGRTKMTTARSGLVQWGFRGSDRRSGTGKRGFVFLAALLDISRNGRDRGNDQMFFALVLPRVEPHRNGGVFV
jgi:hypothetical protein